VIGLHVSGVRISAMEPKGSLPHLQEPVLKVKLSLCLTKNTTPWNLSLA